MAGHSKWANIKHKKAKEDAKRGKIFTKLIKEIMVAVKEGGADPAGNSRLRLALEKAKAANMPQDNVTRAIKKASGELEGVNFEAITYEGYGPFGSAVIVEALTDNKKRTVSDVRHIFTKYGGNLAENGAVSWMFEHKGIIRCSGNMSEDELIELLLDYEVDDISYQDGIFTIQCRIQDLEFIKQVLETADMKVEDARLEWIAKNPVTVSDAEQEAKVFKFLEALEDLDDVQDVYTNVA